MIRLSGSVKFPCAFGVGFPAAVVGILCEGSPSPWAWTRSLSWPGGRAPAPRAPFAILAPAWFRPRVVDALALMFDYGAAFRAGSQLASQSSWLSKRLASPQLAPQSSAQDQA